MSWPQEELLYWYADSDESKQEMVTAHVPLLRVFNDVAGYCGVCLFVCVYLFICVCVHLCVAICMCVCVPVKSICVYVCMYVCAGVYLSVVCACLYLLNAAHAACCMHKNMQLCS